MTAVRSASALESWASSLGFLAAEVSPGIESMARRLDLVMSAGAPPSTGLLEPNGFGGIARQGDLGRLLLSDWALAEHEPDEFLRRLVTSELSYLERSYEEPRPPGQITVLLDPGPDQLGAPRLAHLAALVVLERRSRSLGVPLVVGVLGQGLDRWHMGPLPELFAVWLSARNASPVQQADLDARIDALPANSTLWLFGAPSLHLDVGALNHSRLSAIESRWGPDGATLLEVNVADRLIELEIPDRGPALRLLRGHGLRRREGVGRSGTSDLRFPSFHGSVRRLLCRGDGDDELVAIAIPQSADRDGGRAKRRRFPGPVLAASLIGSRTVALVAIGELLRVVVVGKRLGNVANLELPMDDVDLDNIQVEELTHSRLEPLFFSAGSIVVRLGDSWWSIKSPGEVVRRKFIAAAASPASDQPRFLTRFDSGIRVDMAFTPNVSPDTRVILGSGRTVAIEMRTGEWIVNGDSDGTIRVDPAATVCGLVATNDGPALLVRSVGGRIVRLVRTGRTQTLSKFSTDVANIEVHPTLPLVAIERLDRSIDVIDLNELDLLCQIRGRS